MGFHLKKKEDVAQGLRRVLQEQTGKAIEALSAPAEEREQGIHDFRVACKRLRAVLRLLHRGEQGPARDLDRRIGAIAAELSVLRDADVMLTTLEGLRQAHPNWFDPNALAKAREDLRQERDRAREQAPEYAVLAADLQQRMREVPAGLSEIDLPQRKRDLRRAFRGTRERLDRSVAKTRPGHSEDIHRWRKRVKDLLYQGQLLGRILKGHPKRDQRILAQLATVLGEHHDLAVMAQLFEAKDLYPSTAAAEALPKAMQEQQQTLEQEAVRLYTLLRS